MKLYKVTGTNRSGEKFKRFAGSQSEAATIRKTFNSESDVPRESLKTEEVEVTQNKAGIIEALNNAIAA